MDANTTDVDFKLVLGSPSPHNLILLNILGFPLYSQAAEALGHKVLGWRKLTTCNTDLGKAALDTEPVIEQIFLLVKDDPAVTDVEQLVSQGMNGVWRQWKVRVAVNRH